MAEKTLEEMRQAVAEIREKMAAAAREAGRDPAAVQLCAACKTRTAETVAASAALPIDVFGENHVQELCANFDAGAYCGKPSHFIGHLQTNKIKKVLGRASLIQSVDSEHLLNAIEKEAAKAGIVQNVLLEVNIGGEESKSGVSPEALWPLLDAAAAQEHIRVKGLMAIPPVNDDDAQNRRYLAAVHDLCGYGKCSLTAAIPILSAAGCDVCPVPTALFSAHTRYAVFTFHDTTDILSGYLDAWQKEDVELDGVYSGFLGSPDQVAIIQRLYREYPNALRLVDPVMGDAGEMYPTYTPELCEAMGALADGADVLMPNLTEASILTKRDYPGQDIDEATVNELLGALLELGAKNVVLKGIDHGDGKIVNYVASASTGVAGKIELAHEKLPYMIHGTGDAFASALCGAVMAGRGLAESAEIAGEFVRHAMVSTRNQPHFEDRGVSFELNLGELTDLVK